MFFNEGIKNAIMTFIVALHHYRIKKHCSINAFQHYPIKKENLPILREL